MKNPTNHMTRSELSCHVGFLKITNAMVTLRATGPCRQD